MSRKNARDYFELALFWSALFAVILASTLYAIKKPAQNVYFLAKESVRERVAPRQIKQFISPFNLRMQPTGQNATNLWGWAILTNKSGQTTTQWFRCTLQSGVVIDVRLYFSDPGATNASPM